MSDYVGLNVGGKIFQTSRLTLTRYPDSFFSRLLDGDIPSHKDDQGNYLIDQDGEIFRHVLNFLRYGELHLPDGFKETDLLIRQAIFFSLQALKEVVWNHADPVSLQALKISIEQTKDEIRYSSQDNRLATKGSVGLMFYGGNLFNTTRKTLSRERSSFFTQIMQMGGLIERDSQGNYIMDRDGSGFHHVLNYLRDGGIFNPVTSAELDRLQEDAEHFTLKVLGDHIQSIKNFNHSCPMQFYSWVPSPIMGYVSGVPCSCVAYWLRSNPHIEEICDKLFEKIFTINDDVECGVVNVAEINPNRHLSIIALEDYIKKHSQYDFQFPQVRLSDDCTRLDLGV